MIIDLILAILFICGLFFLSVLVQYIDKKWFEGVKNVEIEKNDTRYCGSCQIKCSVVEAGLKEGERAGL